MASDIFISYAREDRERVQPIAEALAERGYGVWWDKGLRSGEDYRDRIEEMLQTARCVVVAWSRQSVESDFVIDEAGRGQRRGVLLPVFIDEGIEPPLGFGGIHTTDLSGWLDGRDDAALEQFVGDVENQLRPAAGVRAATPRPPAASGTRLSRRALGFLAVLGLVVAIGVGYRVMRPSADRAGNAEVSSAVAGASALDGTFRLMTWNGYPLPLEYPDSSTSLVAAWLEVQDAASAARNGTGRWINRATTRAPGGLEATTRWEGRFRAVGETLYVPTPEGDRRYVYAFGAGGGLTMTDVDTKQVWTYVRQ